MEVIRFGNGIQADGDVSASGKLKAQTQATEQGDAVILGADGKVPAELLDSPHTWTITGDGTQTVFTHTHNLGYIPRCTMYKVNGSNYELFITDVSMTSTTATATFHTAPASGTTFLVVM